jgi:hypothetical protein
MNVGNDNEKQLIQRYLHWSNNENAYTEFQFLLTGDLSALTGSGLAVNL